MALNFGGMSMVQGAASSWGGLMALRFLIGVFEAGYGPGVAFFLSWFYSRQGMALRYSLFIGAAAFANAMASCRLRLVSATGRYSLSLVGVLGHDRLHKLTISQKVFQQSLLRW